MFGIDFGWPLKTGPLQKNAQKKRPSLKTGPLKKINKRTFLWTLSLELDLDLGAFFGRFLWTLGANNNTTNKTATPSGAGFRPQQRPCGPAAGQHYYYYALQHNQRTHSHRRWSHTKELTTSWHGRPLCESEQG
jgi:hypothetical protein